MIDNKTIIMPQTPLMVKYVHLLDQRGIIYLCGKFILTIRVLFTENLFTWCPWKIVPTNVALENVLY